MKGRSTWALASCLALLLPACRKEANVRLPDTASAGKSIILGYLRGSTMELSAFERDASGAYPVEPRQTPDQMFLLVYPQTLEELGLPAGDLIEAKPGTLSRPLPDSEQIFVSPGALGVVPSWQKVALPPELARFWIPRARPITRACPPMTVSRFVLPSGKDWVSIHSPLDAHSAIMATAWGEFYRVSAAGLEPLNTLTGTVSRRTKRSNNPIAHGAGYRTDDNRLWLAGCVEDPLATLDLNQPISSDGLARPCADYDWVSNASAIVRMDGARGGAPYELFAMTRKGKLLQYNQASVLPLVQYDLEKSLIYDFLAWVDPGSVAVTVAAYQFYWIRPGAQPGWVAPEWEKTSFKPDVNRARRFPRGLAVSTHSAQENFTAVLINERNSGIWHVLTEGNLDGPIADLRPLGEGFVFGGYEGLTTGWWEPDTGFCSVPQDEKVLQYGFYEVWPINQTELFAVAFKEPIAEPEAVFWVSRSQ